MPLYPLRCLACQHLFEELCHHSVRHAQTCPKCGAAETEVNIGELTFATERVFSGSEAYSVMHECHPSEVQDYRRKFPTARVDDSGRISFDSRGDQRKFAKQMHEFREKNDPAYALAKELKAARQKKPASKERTALAKRRMAALAAGKVKLSNGRK